MELHLAFLMAAVALGMQVWPMVRPASPVEPPPMPSLDDVQRPFPVPAMPEQRCHVCGRETVIWHTDAMGCRRCGGCHESRAH